MKPDAGPAHESNRPSTVRTAAAVRAIDGLSVRIGRFVSWLVVVMVLVGAFNALARYAGRFTGIHLGSNAYLEAQWYLFSVIFLLGAAYTLQQGAHVRVDVLYGRLSRRGRAWIDLAGTVLLLIPFSIFMIRVSWPSVRNSWLVREVSPDPGGLPRYPLKALILVSFALLIVQGVAEVLRRIAVLRDPSRGESAAPRPPEGKA